MGVSESVMLSTVLLLDHSKFMVDAFVYIDCMLLEWVFWVVNACIVLPISLSYISPHTAV